MSEEQQQQQQAGGGQGQQQESVTITVGSNQQQEAPVSSRFLSAVNKARVGMLERPIRYDVLSIVFTLLILIGGIIGYVTANSMPSLISAIVFALLLAGGTYLEGSRKNPYPLIVVLVALAGLFTYRYLDKMKFMPSGLLAILTYVMLARHCYLVYLKRRQEAPTGAATTATTTTEQQQP